LPRWLTLSIFSVALASRILQTDVLWVEEAYPSAAALQIAFGKMPYRDFWFDKPPLFAYLYALWGGEPGLVLRLAGAVYVTLCAWLAARLARHWIAGGLLAFFLIFENPAAALVLGPDLLTLAPVMGAVLVRDKPFAAGALMAVAFHCNVKAILFLPLVFSWQSAASFAILASPAFFIPGYIEQVWRWGAVYARDTFIDDPLRTGAAKTAAWLGFHAALLIPAARAKWDRRLILWTLAAAACAAAGFRFFPRYYFHLLPPLAIAAAHGWPKLGRVQWAVIALLIIPVVRYTPAYWRGERSRDLAMFRDARQAAEVIREQAAPGDTIFTWGYRPEIDALARLPLGSRFLESQPLTCVFADRHLTMSRTNGEDKACAERRLQLARSNPTFVVDGLGRYNPALAITAYPELADWLKRYRVVALTNGTMIYRIRDEAARIR
jgi:hypothetical protein